MDAIGYSIIGIYFIALIVIGVLCSRKQDSLSDFFLAGRSIPTWAAMAAVVATETSAITFIGAPARSFGEGGDLSFLQVVIGYIVARFILAAFFLPKFFQHEIVTIYEFLGMRFGYPAQRMAGVFFFITRALAAGVRHYAAALVISAITGFNLIWAIVITGAISFVYSILGGISAVIWTEVMQFMIMIAGAVFAFFYCLGNITGGMDHVIQVALENHKLVFFHWDWSASGQYSLLIGMLGGLTLCLASHGADQDLVQRLLSCKNLRSAQIALVGSGFIVFFQFAFFLFLGVMLFVFFGGQLPEGVEKADQILPAFVTGYMPQAVAAIVIAAILSAALSSTASALNSLSSTAVSELNVSLRGKELSNTKMVFISRLFTLFWTVVLILIALAAQNAKFILDTGLSIPSYTYGSLLAAFLLGIFTPFKTQKALIVSMVLAVFVVLALSFSGIHWTWFVPSGALSTIAFSYGLSYFMKPDEVKQS